MSGKHGRRCAGVTTSGRACDRRVRTGQRFCGVCKGSGSFIAGSNPDTTQAAVADAAGSLRRPSSTPREDQALLDRLTEGPAEAARRLAHEQARIFGEWPNVTVRARHIRTGPREHIDRVLDGFTVLVRDHRGDYKATVATTIVDGKEHERAAAGREWENQQTTRRADPGDPA